jgi:hypothetical protein
VVVEVGGAGVRDDVVGAQALAARLQIPTRRVSVDRDQLGVVVPPRRLHQGGPVAGREIDDRVGAAKRRIHRRAHRRQRRHGCGEQGGGQNRWRHDGISSVVGRSSFRGCAAA